MASFFNGIDVFAGAGGLSLGAVNAGIMVSTAIEYENNAAKTYKKNHPQTRIIIDDIRNIDPNYLEIDSPFIIFGGPPCQGFSVSNRQKSRNNYSNNNLFLDFLRFVEALNPEWVLFENVEGFVSFNKGGTLKTVCRGLNDLGYSLSWKVLNASEYGVPQDRNRFILVANRCGIAFLFPPPSTNKITVYEAIGDLPVLENGAMGEALPYSQKPSLYAKELRKELSHSLQNYVSKNTDLTLERYKYIKPGQNWKAIPESLMANYKDKTRCHSGIYKRLNPDKPSVVISNYRKNMLIHPSQDRGLSVREAARLQSFPDDYFFEGSLMHIQQQIGNAVPPKMAEAVFKQILKLNISNE